MYLGWIHYYIFTIIFIGFPSEENVLWAFGTVSAVPNREVSPRYAPGQRSGRL